MMWEMDNFRSAIVSKLTAAAPTLDAAQQIHLALKFSITGWIPAAVEKLVCRSEPPSVQEAQTMGLDIATKIWTMRERNRSRNVSKVRNDAHQKLYDAWVAGCTCRGCIHGKEVAPERDAGPVDIDYAEFDTGVRQEVQFMDVSDVPLTLG
jgi:hypothetical protein